MSADTHTKDDTGTLRKSGNDFGLTHEHGKAADRSEIMRIIEKETASWLLRDVEAWESCWVREDHAQHISARPATGAGVLMGFDDIRFQVVEGMRRHPDAGLSPEEVRRENWRVRIGEDMAWVTFNQIAPVTAPAHSAPGFHKQVRVMEKADGHWLIAAVVRIPGRIGFYDCPWVRVDITGRALEMSDGADAVLRDHRALQFTGGRLNGRTRSNEKLLGLKLMEADESLRICELKPPIPVVFMHDDDAHYSLCWISTSDEMIVVLLDDGSFAERSIEEAGKLYGLTKSQMRVAKEIAGGRDLPQAAQALGIQTNTIRTHVKRMFDKVGVNGQTALMRALLSVGPPAVLG